MKNTDLMKLAAFLEIVAAILVLWLDIFIPTLVILPLMLLLMLLHREKIT